MRFPGGVICWMVLELIELIQRTPALSDGAIVRLSNVRLMRENTPDRKILAKLATNK